MVLINKLHFGHCLEFVCVREVEKLRGEVAEKDAANQRLHAMHSSRLLEQDGDSGFGYGRRQRYSAVGINDTSRCFGHKCTLM